MSSDHYHHQHQQQQKQREHQEYSKDSYPAPMLQNNCQQLGDFTPTLPILTCLVHGLAACFSYIAHIAGAIFYLYSALSQEAISWRLARILLLFARWSGGNRLLACSLARSPNPPEKQIDCNVRYCFVLPFHGIK